MQVASCSLPNLGLMKGLKEKGPHITVNHLLNNANMARQSNSPGLAPQKDLNGQGQVVLVRAFVARLPLFPDHGKRDVGSADKDDIC